MKLDKDSFIAWLGSFDRQAIVGVRGETGCCPIAIYLRECTGQGWDVMGSHLTQTSSGEAYPSPRWVYEFIDKIDSPSPDDPDEEHQLNVTAGEALDILTGLVAKEHLYA